MNKREWLLSQAPCNGQSVCWFLCDGKLVRDDDKAVRAVRAFLNRGAKYGQPKNPIWQIKNKLNYGRY